MNRRQFFGMTAAAVAAAGLPALVLPEKTIFLPPKGGWRLREVRQWTVNNDCLPSMYLPEAELGMEVTIVNRGSTELMIYDNHVVTRDASISPLRDGEIRTLVCVPDKSVGFKWVSI